MKCFSVEFACTAKKYDTEFLPLLHRMLNLEELTLNIYIGDGTRFIDGPKIKNDILVHLPQLSKFIFHIRSFSQGQHLFHHPLSEDAIQRTFLDITSQSVVCMLIRYSYAVKYHVFSLPFTFYALDQIGNRFPLIIFTHVTRLGVEDAFSFEHEFFLRIAHHLIEKSNFCKLI